MHLTFPNRDVAPAQLLAESASGKSLFSGAAIRFAETIENLSQENALGLESVDVQIDAQGADIKFPGGADQSDASHEKSEFDVQGLVQAAGQDQPAMAPEKNGPSLEVHSAKEVTVEAAQTLAEKQQPPTLSETRDRQSGTQNRSDMVVEDRVDVPAAGNLRKSVTDRSQSLDTQPVANQSRIDGNVAKPINEEVAVSSGAVGETSGSSDLPEPAPDTETLSPELPWNAGQVNEKLEAFTQNSKILQTQVKTAPVSTSRRESAAVDSTIRSVGFAVSPGENIQPAPASNTIENSTDPTHPRVETLEFGEAEIRTSPKPTAEINPYASLGSGVPRLSADTAPVTHRDPNAEDNSKTRPVGKGEPLTSLADNSWRPSPMAPDIRSTSIDRNSASLGVVLSLNEGEERLFSEIKVKLDSPFAVADAPVDQPVLQKVDLPQTVVRQLVATVQQMPGGPVEIALSPEELGKVRLAISNQESGGISVFVSAERPETLALVRRHVDQLAQEYHNLGYSNVSFSFGQSDHPQGDSSHGFRETSQMPQDILQQEQPVAQITLAASAGLDLRL